MYYAGTLCFFESTTYLISILSTYYLLKFQISILLHVLYFRCIHTSYSLHRIKNLREEKYMKIDKISSNFTLIYKAPMDTYLAVSKHVTNLSLAIVSSLMGWSYVSNNTFIDVTNQEMLGKLSCTNNEMIIMTVGFFVMALSVQVLAHRYPLRIYRNQNKYLAIFEGALPTTKTEYEFQKGNVEAIPPSGVLPWNDSVYKIKGKKVILLLNNFKTPSELYEMQKN